MSGRYIFPYNEPGDYLPLSGGTVTGQTNFTAGLSANTITASTITVSGDVTTVGFSAETAFIQSGFTFDPSGATQGWALVASDDQGNAEWKDLFVIASGGTSVQDGINTFTGGTKLRPTVNLVDSPVVENIYANNSVTASTLSSTTLNVTNVDVGGDIIPKVDNVSSLGTSVRRFRSLNTVNGVAVNFTATTLHMGNLDINENNIVLTGDTLNGGNF